jgi:hypothetical protein
MLKAQVYISRIRIVVPASGKASSFLECAY